jgi:uncharacterized protein YoxC
MEMQVFLVTMSVAMLLLTLVLIVLLIMLSRSLGTAAEILRSIERGLQPVLEDVRTVSANVAQVSESVKAGVEKINHLAGALGSFGDDVEAGRRAIRSVLDVTMNSFQPWLSKLRSFKSRFFTGNPARKEIRYE